MKQLSLFECSTYLNRRTIKEILAMSAEKSGLSTECIAIKMNELAARFGVSLKSGDNGNNLSTTSLEQWLKVNETSHSMPLHAVAIFCQVVNDTSILAAIVKPLGFSIIDEVDRKKLTWAEAKMSIRDQNRLIRKIEGEL